MLPRAKFALFFVFIFLTSCGEDEPQSGPQKYGPVQTVQYKTVAGVDPNLLSLDVYTSGSTGSRPVVVYVHGGAWALGDKSNSIDNKRNLFESLNYVFVSVNYRLSPANEQLLPDRVMFPTHNNDVADAIAWVINNIGSFGGDPAKVALLGHSAGAHLVSLTGVSDQFLPARGIDLTKLKGVASIDTEGYDVLTQVAEKNINYINAFGTNEPDLIAASPLRNIKSQSAYPPFFVARRGNPSRIALATTFIDALTNAGVKVSVITASQYDHEGINDAIGAPGETAVTTPLVDFFETVFK